MNKRLLLLIAGTCLSVAASAQVGINNPTPDNSAVLDLTSSSKGLLIPRLTAAQRTGIASPATGLMVYQTDGTQQGFWYYMSPGGWTFLNPAPAGDNLGNHTATTNLGLNNNWLGNDGTASGIRIDNTGSVGIGTSAIRSWLTIRPFNEEPKITLYDNGSTANHYGFGVGNLGLNYHVDAVAASHKFYAGGKNGNGTELMRMQGNGFVGISDANPQSRLSISSNAAEPKITLWDGNSLTDHYGFGVSSTQLNYHVDFPGSSHVFYANGKNGDGKELMRIKGYGQVGIGTSNPSGLLTVSDWFPGLPMVGLFEGNHASYTSVFTNAMKATAYPMWGYSRQGTQVGAHFIDTNNKWHLWLNNGANALFTRLTVEGLTGYIGVGTTTPLSWLSIRPYNTEPKITLYDNGSTFNHYGFGVSASQLNYHVDAASANHIFYAGGKNGNGTELMRIEGDGQVGIGTSSIGANKLRVERSNNSTSGVIYAASTYSGNTDNIAVEGSAVNNPGFGIGGNFTGGFRGVYGVANGATWASSAIGVTGHASGTAGSRYGVYGSSFLLTATGTTSYGIFGIASGAGTNWAGYFQGNTHVAGTLSKTGGTFRIDHPQDPENKYLVHSFVESPNMMNVYNGNVTTDAQGFASVALPGYFEAENKDFKYQLTVMGQFAQAIVKEKVQGNRFVIQTDKPGVEVSWQVTGVRNDKWAQQNPIIAEEAKKPEHRGKYLNPEVYGKPASEALFGPPAAREEKRP